jgi:hypothetical protein
MERKVFVISSNTQKQVIIDSKAETLGQLKEELDNHNISYEGMAFFEGRTKVELKSNDTILPFNFSFKGEITNDLVIMLTAPHKKIKSGIMTRKECYDYIKSKSLSKTFTEIYSKNYTNATTIELNEFCNTSNSTLKQEASLEEVKIKEEPVYSNNNNNTDITNEGNTIEFYLKEILNVLTKLELFLPTEIYKETLAVNKPKLEKQATKSKVVKNLSKEEIDEMFDFI